VLRLSEDRGMKKAKKIAAHMWAKQASKKGKIWRIGSVGF
jgi:hypothetical protein